MDETTCPDCGTCLNVLGFCTDCFQIDYTKLEDVKFKKFYFDGPKPTLYKLHIADFANNVCSCGARFFVRDYRLWYPEIINPSEGIPKFVFKRAEDCDFESLNAIAKLQAKSTTWKSVGFYDSSIIHHSITNDQILPLIGNRAFS